MVVSVAEMTVFIVEGILTFPLVLQVVRICMVPNVLKVEIKLVDSSSSLPWLLPELVWFGLGSSTTTFLSGENQIFVCCKNASHFLIGFCHNAFLGWVLPCILGAIDCCIHEELVDF